MTGYYVQALIHGSKDVGPMTWAPTVTLAEKYAETLGLRRDVEQVIIFEDSDLSDLGEVYHETSTVEAQMEDFATRAAGYDKEVESAWSTLRRHKLDHHDLGDAAVFAVAEVIRKMEEEIVWLNHREGLDS